MNKTVDAIDDVWHQELTHEKTRTELVSALDDWLWNQNQTGYQFDLMWTGEASNLATTSSAYSNTNISAYSTYALEDYKNYSGESYWPDACMFNASQNANMNFPHDDGVNDTWLDWYNSGLTYFLDNVSLKAEEYGMPTYTSAFSNRWADGQNYSAIANTNIKYMSGHIMFTQRPASFEVHNATIGTDTKYCANIDMGDDPSDGGGYRDLDQVNSFLLNGLSQSNHLQMWRPHIVNRNWSYNNQTIIDWWDWVRNFVFNNSVYERYNPNTTYPLTNRPDTDYYFNTSRPRCNIYSQYTGSDYSPDYNSGTKTSDGFWYTGNYSGTVDITGPNGEIPEEVYSYPKGNFNMSNRYEINFEIKSERVLCEKSENYHTIYGVYGSDKIISTPRLIDLTAQNASTGERFTFEVNVTSDNELDEVFLEYWYFDDEKENLSLSKNGLNWSCELNISSTNNILHYIFHAKDTLGNWNSTVEELLNIIDNSSPLIIDKSLANATTGDSFKFRAEIFDNIGVHSAYVKYWFSDDTSTSQNVSVKNLQGDKWVHQITLAANSTDTFHYMISAVDDSDNWASTLIKDVIITDDDAPVAVAGEDMTIDEGYLITLDGSKSYDNIGITKYNWTCSEIDSFNLNGSTPSYKFDKPGIYNITLVVEDYEGNLDEDNLVIKVKKEKIFEPNNYYYLTLVIIFIIGIILLIVLLYKNKNKILDYIKS